MAIKTLFHNRKLPKYRFGPEAMALVDGVGSLEDVMAAAALPRLDALIVGRALYDGRVDLREALAALVALDRAPR